MEQYKSPGDETESYLPNFFDVPPPPTRKKVLGTTATLQKNCSAVIPGAEYVVHPERHELCFSNFRGTMLET